ncbi:alpha-N-acetyl-neuraminyl-2,3-beta-galactosyl-1,3-N-acetyl-galactosaminide alpha-2,6-sialyltransferase-like [Antedon mediterranea]|uniref:alpha-N-acetyl-neuraminyl-2,3-beta-galactosyl-1, 3-N-acetyl-galactosaminide alpha-2,6-sialyltransferase-like n=1 Tax=Antedon mediterranea TaxID=105859 RepID=UPI003AF6CD62
MRLPSRRSKWYFCLNRKNLILGIFWYSVIASSLFLYYTHESHQKDSRFRRFYQSLFVEDTIRCTSASLASTTRITTQGTAAYNLTVLRKYWKLFQLRNNFSEIKYTIPEKYNNARTRQFSVPKKISSTNVPVTTKINVTEKPVPVTQAPVVKGYWGLLDNKKLQLHCSQCAVVASSGHLLNSTAGQEIDKYECVIRMNSAPIKGYEKFVGTKTTVRVMGHVNMLWLNQSEDLQKETLANTSTMPEKMIVPWLYNIQINRKTDKYFNLAKNFSLKYGYKEMYLLDSEKMKYAETTFHKETGLTRREARTWLTTGWMTMLFSIDVCDKIDVFGLVQENHCLLHPNDSTPYHYYEPDDKTECSYYKVSEERLTSGHKFITEKAIFARWAHRHNITFLYPSWNNSHSSNSTNKLETPFLKLYREAKANGSLPEIPRKTIIQKKIIEGPPDENGVRRPIVKRIIKKIIVRRKVPVVKPKK